VPTKAALSLPFLSWTGDRKYNERLMGRDKDREITQQLPSQAKQAGLAEISLVLFPIKIRAGKWEIKTKS